MKTRIDCNDCLPERTCRSLCKTAAAAAAAVGLSLLLVACTANKPEGNSETGSIAASGAQAVTGSVSDSKSQVETAGRETGSENGGAAGTLTGTETAPTGGEAAQQTDSPSGSEKAPENTETSTGNRPAVTDATTPGTGNSSETEAHTEPTKPTEQDETSEDLPAVKYDTPDEIEQGMPDSGEDLQTGKP